MTFSFECVLREKARTGLVCLTSFDIMDPQMQSLKSDISGPLFCEMVALVLRHFLYPLELAPAFNAKLRK